jgi:uncharacterized protein
MRIVRVSEHSSLPWKNGGGTATAIVEHPPGAGFDTFQWRISGAHIGRDGPFSLFPHVDRTMFILRGAALDLHGLDVSATRLTVNSEPCRFPGDIPVSATLPSGPIDNLNIMSDRRCFQHRAWRLFGDARQTLPQEGTLVIYAETGGVGVQCDGENIVLSAHDCVLTDGDAEITLAMGSKAILVRITPI